MPPFPAWQPPPPPAPSWWDNLTSEGAGSRLLAWVGGIVTLAGVVLLLILAVQRGYLGPVPRVVFGAAFGVTLVGVGLWLHRKPSGRIGAHAALGTGVAVLYLDIVAATALLDLVPAYAGLVIALLLAVGGVLLAGRWRTQPLACYIVACSAVCAPIVADGFGPLLLGFLLVLQIATTPVQVVRRWGGLCLAAGLPPVLAALMELALSGGGQLWPAGYLCLLTSLVQLVVATVNALRTPTDHVAVALLLIAPAPTLVSALLLPRLEATLLVAAICVPLLIGWALHRLRLLAVSDRFGLAAGGTAEVALFQVIVTALDGDAETLALLGKAVLLAVLAYRTRYATALLPSVLFGLAGLLTALAGPVRFDVLALPTDGMRPGAVVTLAATGLLIAVTAVVLCWVAHRLGRLAEHPVAAAVTAGVIALYGAAAVVLSIGLAISPDRTGFLLGHVLVTVSWTVGALVLLVRGVRSVPPRVAGLSLVGAAVAKLVLFDLSSLDGMARVAAFLVAGLVLLAAGHRYARLVAGRVT